MTDDYQGWRELLQKRPYPIIEDRPLCGFWRKRAGARMGWQRVAIWSQGDGRLECTVDNTSADPVDVWLWCARFPISEEDFRFHESNGRWRESLIVVDHDKTLKRFKDAAEVKSIVADLATQAWIASGRAPTGCEVRREE